MKIDPEFRALIAPLQPEEREQLEANLVEYGCRDALVIWNGILIDGHNRHEICARRGIKYRTIDILLPSRAHALLWIEENQLGRRNLTDDQRAVIALAILKRRKRLNPTMSERGKQGGRGKKKQPDTPSGRFQHDRSKETLPATAKSARVSERKLRAVSKLPEALLPAIRSGEKTVQQVRSEIRRAERIEKAAALSAPPAIETIARRFPVIYADPPWQYEYTETEARAIENNYPTMDLSAICALKIAEVATDDAVLFLWATNPKLPEALRVLEAWGFEYRTNLVWVKDKIGMGYYARQQHELLLIAKRGNLPVPEPERRPSSVINAPREKHSAKPEVVYELIEQMYPDLPRLELFARRAAREGWSVWGNQAEQRTA